MLSDLSLDLDKIIPNMPVGTLKIDEKYIDELKDYTINNSINLSKKEYRDKINRLYNDIGNVKPIDNIINNVLYFDNYEEVAVYPRGYRVLNKIPRMPSNIVANLVKTFKSFQYILLADVDKLDEVEGIGEVRARTIKQSLRRMQEQFVFDNLMI